MSTGTNALVRGFLYSAPIALNNPRLRLCQT